MSRPMQSPYGFDIGNQPDQFSSPESNRLFSTNLPPQYQQQESASAHWPDESQIRMPFESISDTQAVSIVRHDFETAANYRYQNHDWRWTIADSLYTGWKQAKFWEGTRIPRANVSVMVDFEQIESIMPSIMRAMFGDPEWFEATGLGLTSPKAARAIKDILLAQLGESKPREVVRRAMKSAAMYGNGIIMVGWCYEARKSLSFIPQFTPRMRQVQSPIDNVMQSFPSQQFDRRIVEQVVEDYINRPYIKYIPLKRFFIDPNAPSPVVPEAPYCAIESTMRVDELDALRDQPGFESMPDMYTLYQLSKRRNFSQADSTQADQEAARRASWMPWVDQSSDPAAARVQVIHYFTKDRIIWSLNNRYVCFNKPNPIGRITIHDTFYADLLDRFYAMAISDVVEGEQRVQEGLLGARLDELSLAIHPTTVKQRGSGTPIYQVRVRPGAVAESSDPKNDVIRQYPMNATANAHLETQASELRVQKYTGVTDLAMVGVGSTTNPAARTATGASTQSNAAAARIIYLVENAEDTVIEPLLKDCFEYNQRFLDPNQMIEGAKGQQLDPIAIFGGKAQFSMRASAKMQSRQALLTLMPMTLQAMLNPQLLAQLAAMGQTVDFVEMMQMFMDASGYRQKFNWVRPLTQQEIQMMQKPDKAQEDLALQQDRMQSLKEMQISRDEMALLKEFVRGRMQAEKPVAGAAE